MLDLIYLHRDRVHALWLILGALLLMIWWDTHTRRVLARFISPVMQARLIVRQRPLTRWLYHGLMVAALTLGVLAWMRPQSHTTRTQRSFKQASDIMVVLDVSRSMLAADTAPNRLERARADLRDMLPSLSGHRVGLIAFAGRAEPLVALTLDHDYFRQSLDLASDLTVSRGGTRIGDALRAAIAAFPDPEPLPDGRPQTPSRVIILLTDGEDHESNPVAAAEAAAAAHATIIAIGFGSEDGSELFFTNPATGAREQVLDRDQQPVRSRLDGETLRAIAQRTGGLYIPAGTAVLDLHAIVERHIQPMISATEQVTERDAFDERNLLFLLASLSCLIAAAAARASGRISA
jgi:Ca-activated chloride channel family protein